MAFRIPYQTAPVPTAIPGAPSAWSATSTSSRTVTGIYEGRRNATYTFTVADGGTIGAGTVVITWTDGTESGRLDVGAGYTAGTPRILHAGMSIAFGAGTANLGETFTVAVVAQRGLRGYRGLAGNEAPTDVIMEAMGQVLLDTRRRSDSGVLRQRTVALLREPVLRMDWLDQAQRPVIDHIEGERPQVTVGENYDGNTVLLWRPARGIMPVIGPRPTFARAGVASYTDPVTGLLRLVPANTERHIAGKAGRALILDGGATNLQTFSHASASTAAWLVHAGAPVISWDATVPSAIDPEDSAWTNADYRKGAQKVEMAPADAVKPIVSIITATSSTRYAAHIYLRGRGKVTFQLFSGTVDPPGTLIASQQVTLVMNVYQRIVIVGTTGGADNKVSIRVTADEASVVWISAAQVETGHVATHYIETAVGTGSRSAETLTIPMKPPATGSLGFWFRFPAGSPIGAYSLFETNAGGLFSVRYNTATGSLEFYTDAASPLSAVVAIAANVWTHVAVTWDRSATPGQLARAIYASGLSIGSDSTTAWNKAWGAVIEVSRSTGGGAPHDIAYEEVRMDSVAWTPAQVLDQYERLTTDSWLHAHAMFAGRRFRPQAASYRYMENEPSFHDKLSVSIPLTQSDVEPDALVTAL